MVSLNVAWAERAIVAIPQNDPEAKELEAQYPGIHAAMWSASKTELTRQMEADLPNLWSRLENVYMAELTESEIGALTHFYRTPTGQRMIKGLYENVDLTDAVATMAGTADDAKVERAVDEASEAARRKTVAQLQANPADLQALVAVVSVDRMKSVGAKVQQAMSDWFNADDSEGQKKIEAIMTAAAERYIKDREARE
jgi:hypothetical protein